MLFLIVLAATSCSTDGDQPEVQYELVPIITCEMPYYFTAGETYELRMIFKMPTTCHTYKGIYFEGEGNTKTLAIQTVVAQRNDCQPIEQIGTASPETESAKYNFTPSGPGSTYIFKIWTGKNEQGENTYYEVEVPVEN